MACDTPARIAIVGAGPIGLEAALYARFLGYEAAVFEQGRLAESIAALGDAAVGRPFSLLHSNLGLAAIETQDDAYTPPRPHEHLTARQWLERYLSPLATTDLLDGCLHLGASVVGVTRIAPQDAAGGRQQEPHEEDQEEEREGDEMAPDRFSLAIRQASGESSYSAAIVIDTAGLHRQGAAGNLRLDLDEATGDVKRLKEASLAAIAGGEPASSRWRAEDLTHSEPHYYLIGGASWSDGLQFLDGLAQIRLLFGLIGGRPALDLHAGAASLVKKR